MLHVFLLFYLNVSVFCLNNLFDCFFYCPLLDLPGTHTLEEFSGNNALHVPPTPPRSPFSGKEARLLLRKRKRVSFRSRWEEEKKEKEKRN